MNKSLILLLAVCLVSVHAFVKRDAPEAEKNDNYLENLQKQVQDLSKDFNSKLAEVFDPEKIKQGIDQISDTLKKAIEDTKKKSESEKQ